MAIARPGPLVQGLSGSLDSVVFANSNAGLVIRNRPLKSDTFTPAQIEQRLYYSSVVRAWADLTDIRKKGWRNLARQIPTTNALGVRRPLSAFQIFVRHNLLLPDPLTNHIYDPPLATKTPPPTSITWAPHVVGPYYLSFVLPYLDMSSWIIVYGARSFSKYPPKFWNNFRRICTVHPFPLPLDIHELWNEKLGALQEGEYSCVKIRGMATNRLPSNPLIAPAEVAPEGMYPIKAEYFSASKQVKVYFNLPIGPLATHPEDWEIGVPPTGYTYTTIQRVAANILLSNENVAGTPLWEGVWYTNDHDDIESTTGEVCQSFTMYPFSVDP